MRQVVFFMALFICGLSKISAQTKTVDVDFSATLERIKDLGGVNGGPDVLPPKGASTVPPAAIQGYKDAGVTLIRTHDMFGSQYVEYVKSFWTAQGSSVSINASFDPTAESSYLWSAFDGKIDSIVNFGFAPYFRFGVNFGSAYPYPPFDPDKTNFTRFAEVCKRTVMHYNQGWANGKRAGIKYWEIWNEPDSPGFWKDSATAKGFGDSAAFVRMVKAVSEAIKQVEPSAKVGAAGVLSGSILTKRAWIPYFINACRDNKTTLDFFSWHLYGALNPYAIAVVGDYVRGLLNAAGYVAAESHVSETNIRLGEDDARFPAAAQLINTPKHAAYIASQLISAQVGGVDKFMVYRGTTFMNHFNSDTLSGQANPTLSGRGMKAFTELTRFAPQRVKADGSEFVATDASLQKDTLNVMTLAGRSDDQKRCYVLVSNYNSTYKTVSATLKNLPWTQGSVKQTVMKINASGTVTETSQMLAPSATLKIDVAEMTAPAVALIRLENATNTDVLESAHQNAALLGVLSPASGGIYTIRFRLAHREPVRLALYDALGCERNLLLNAETEAGEHVVTFNGNAFAGGVYFVLLRTPSFTRSAQIGVVR